MMQNPAPKSPVLEAAEALGLPCGPWGTARKGWWFAAPAHYASLYEWRARSGSPLAGNPMLLAMRKRPKGWIVDDSYNGRTYLSRRFDTWQEGLEFIHQWLLAKDVEWALDEANDHT